MNKKLECFTKQCEHYCKIKIGKARSTRVGHNLACKFYISVNFDKHSSLQRKKEKFRKIKFYDI